VPPVADRKAKARAASAQDFALIEFAFLNVRALCRNMPGQEGESGAQSDLVGSRRGLSALKTMLECEKRSAGLWLAGVFKAMDWSPSGRWRAGAAGLVAINPGIQGIIWG